MEALEIMCRRWKRGNCAQTEGFRFVQILQNVHIMTWQKWLWKLLGLSLAADKDAEKQNLWKGNLAKRGWWGMC